MHFTRAQLRDLQASFEIEPTVQVLPEIDPYIEDRSKVTLLSVLTTESGVINMSAFPRSDSDPEPLEIVRRRITTITGANDEQMQPENFRKVVRNAPKDLVDYDPDTDSTKLTERGDASLALGGLLLQNISLMRQQRIRDWCGGRLITGKQKVSTTATPQLHRVHILDSLLPAGTLLTAKQLSDLSQGNLGYRNTLGIVERMSAANILTKVRVKRSPPNFAWRIVPERRRIAEEFLNTITSFDPDNRGCVDNGLTNIQRILSDGNGDIARLLYIRGVLSAGSGTRPEPTSLNERLGALFHRLGPDTQLSAGQIGSYIGENVTLERMRRQLGKPGSRYPIECVPVPRPSGSWYKFKLRRPDYSRA